MGEEDGWSGSAAAGLAPLSRSVLAVCVGSLCCCALVGVRDLRCFVFFVCALSVLCFSIASVFEMCSLEFLCLVSS